MARNIATVRVRGSCSGRPIMALLDLLGRRWALGILWHLSKHTMTTRALRDACDDASPTTIQARLAELRDADIVRLMPGEGFALTDLGRELVDAFEPLQGFASRWSRRSGQLAARTTRRAGTRG